MTTTTTQDPPRRRGRPVSKSALLAAQILALYPPPSQATVAEIASATGESHKTISRALYYLARTGKAQKLYLERVGVRHYANVWRLS